jgi:hypothetical protein
LVWGLKIVDCSCSIEVKKSVTDGVGPELLVGLGAFSEFEVGTVPLEVLVVVVLEAAQSNLD